LIFIDFERVRRFLFIRVEGLLMKRRIITTFYIHSEFFDKGLEKIAEQLTFFSKNIIFGCEIFHNLDLMMMVYR